MRKRIGIKGKLNSMVFGIILVFGIMLALVIGKSMQFSNDYSRVLENISKITYIKTNASKVAKSVEHMCGVGADIESSGHKEIVETMKLYSGEIGQNIGDDVEYNQNRNQYESFASEVEKYTAAYENVLAVGSLVENGDEIASFSQRGDWVDTYIVGEEIPIKTLSGNETTGDGTSYSAAKVTGMAAKELEADPTISLSKLREKLIQKYDWKG